MVKKKVNPNKIPLSDSKLDVNKITEAATDKATLIAWAEIFGALADFPEMCTEKLQQLWMDANKAAGRAHRQEDVEHWVSKIEEIAEIELPYSAASLAGVHTKGELNRAIRKIERKSLVFAYSIIGRQFVEKELLPLKDVGRVFQKADSLDKEITDGRITLNDLLEMLRDEFGLSLAASNTGVKLVRCIQEEQKSVTPRLKAEACKSPN